MPEPLFLLEITYWRGSKALSLGLLCLSSHVVHQFREGNTSADALI